MSGRKVLVRMAAAFGVAAVGMVIVTPSAFAADNTDYNAVVSGAPLAPLCQHSPGPGASGSSDKYTNCLVG